MSPHPDHLLDFLTSLSQNMADVPGWPDEQLAGITAPTLLVLGDHDFVTIEQAALMQHLIPGTQLGVLPGTTHMDATRRAVAAHAGAVPGLSTRGQDLFELPPSTEQAMIILSGLLPP